MKENQSKEMMHSHITIISPDRARVWLEGNVHNRPISQAAVNKYAAIMQAREWKLNGDSIIFDRDGRLLDGQHRLWACIEANVSFSSVVVYNADPDDFLTIDQGRGRNTVDHIATAGLLTDEQKKYGRFISASAALLWKYRNHCLYNSARINAIDAINILKSDPGIIEWAIECAKTPIGVRGFFAPIAVVLYLASKSYPDEAREFMEKWRTGAGLFTGSPILSLRNKVLGRGLGRNSNNWDRLGSAVHAWNAFVDGRSLTRVVSPQGDFPYIIGERAGDGNGKRKGK